ncbi:MAG: nucleotidyl transferase AbiEii/AbiGii toxin family protein [Prolixibacteraceae bacterium]|jgi:predicted nucleotidyltransferase component of viral defense system|nr:nucleotidyl transferase AbiEii/AbiGii toxin family protein [Prolixibacteraceae bacterium]
MLHKETIDEQTLELLNQLQTKTYLDNFYLVGGTALALKIGHRKSIDIDLFTNYKFDTEQLLENISNDFSFELFFSASNTLKGSIQQIQIDILAHRYPLIGHPVIIEGIRMLSTEDIIAMKLNAISVSGQRVKDFIDIYFLLDNYSVKEMINFYKKKYTQYNEVNVIKSLTWYDDVDLSDWPLLLKNPKLKWKKVKEKITKATKAYLQTI